MSAEVPITLSRMVGQQRKEIIQKLNHVLWDLQMIFINQQ